VFHTIKHGNIVLEHRMTEIFGMKKGGSSRRMNKIAE
jgi:hypothetical protein